METLGEEGARSSAATHGAHPSGPCTSGAEAVKSREAAQGLSMLEVHFTGGGQFIGGGKSTDTGGRLARLPEPGAEGQGHQ